MIVSIDIGTSYSSLSMIGPEGKPVPVTIGEGGTAWGDKYSLPSAVFVEDNGNILVGQAAMRSRLRKPDCFRMEFKRNLGEDTPLLLGGRSFRVEELYTELLLHMKACVKKTTGEDIELAYLTCPATYRKDKKERLISAAKAAGLFQVELVPEPTAAAMSYVSAGYVKDGQTLLVYDFGGGTFDAALIQYKDGAFLPLGEPLGLPRCGGIDMDRLIYQDMMKAVDPDTIAMLQKKQEHYLRFAGQLSEKAVQIKHQLSSAQTATEYIPMGWDQLEYTLIRQAFEQMIAPMIDQTIHVCEDALTSAGLEKSGLSAVVLVGGTSRVPLVQQMVQQFAGKVPVYAAPDVDLAVVQGALSYRLYNEAGTAEKWYQDAKKLEEQGCSSEEIAALYRNAAKQGDADAKKRCDMLVKQSQAASSGSVTVSYKTEEKPTPNNEDEMAEKWYQDAKKLEEQGGSPEVIAALYRKAAEQGYAAAQHNLGIYYESGRGVMRDPCEAVKWYHKAAEQGDVVAQYNMGACYEFGKGVSKNATEAMKWYRKAADQGLAGAKKRYDMLVKQSQSTSSGSVTVSYKAEEKPTPQKSDATILAPVRKGGQWGYIDQTGKFVLPLQWEWASQFSEGLAWVEKGGKYGAIDKSGRVIIPCQYSGFPHDFHEGIAAVCSDDCLRTHYGFIDKSGTVISPLHQWEGIASDFHEGLAYVTTKKWRFFGEGEYDYAYIDKSGKKVIPFQGWNNAGDFSEGLAPVRFNYRWSYIDKSGKVVITYNKWDYAYSFSESMAQVKKGGNYGFIDKTGKQIIPCQWDKAGFFHEGLAWVKRDGKWGAIDKSGNEVIPCRWEPIDRYDIGSRFDEGLAPVGWNGKCGYIDKSGKVVIPCQWDYAAWFSNGLAIVKKDGKYGFINKTGELVSPCQWDNAREFRKAD